MMPNSRNVVMVRLGFAADTVRWDRVMLIRLAGDRRKVYVERMQTRLPQGILSVMLLPVLLHILTMADQLPSFSSQRQGARPKVIR